MIGDRYDWPSGEYKLDLEARTETGSLSLCRLAVLELLVFD